MKHIIFMFSDFICFSSVFIEISPSFLEPRDRLFERIELLFPWQSPGVNYRFPQESHRFKLLLRVVSLIHGQNVMSPRFMLFSSRLWFRFWTQTTETHSDLNWSPQQQRQIHNHIMQCSFTIMYVLTNTCPNKI
jgi:hypothetical protein